MNSAMLLSEISMTIEEKQKDFEINKTVIKMIHADGFFPKDEAKVLSSVVKDVNYIEKEYGLEIPHFNLILPGAAEVFSKILGEEVDIDKERAGIIRKPFNNMIHFESFEDPNEWCFILALETTTLNLYKHVEDIRYNDLNKVNSVNVFQGTQFNYRNMFEWDVHTNIILECNQGVFIRPWVFHSLSDSLVQYYRIIPKHLKEKTIEQV